MQVDKTKEAPVGCTLLALVAVLLLFPLFASAAPLTPSPYALLTVLCHIRIRLGHIRITLAHIWMVLLANPILVILKVEGTLARHCSSVGTVGLGIDPTEPVAGCHYLYQLSQLARLIFIFTGRV